MKRTSTLLFSALAIALLAPPVRAQDDDDDDRPAKPAPSAPDKGEAPGAASCPGRNEVFCRAFEDVARKANASVVSVGSGYGVVIDGVIVTGSAAVNGQASVEVKGAVAGQARVLGVDEANGVAILEAPAGAPSIALADTKGLTIGQFVISVGTDAKPLAVGVLSARDRKVEPKDISSGNFFMGLLSDGLDGPKREFPKVLQHDGPMNDETLGSALVDSDGKLVGVNVGTGFRGSSYALAADDVLASIKAIRSGTLPQPPATHERAPTGHARAYLGASVVEQEGALVVKELADGSPALVAGLQPGDKILTFDGRPVTKLDELGGIFRTKKPGDHVTVEVIRAAKKVSLDVVLGEKK